MNLKLNSSSGKRKISDKDKQSSSKRAMKGNLLVIKMKCTYCGHHKGLETNNKIKCARCKKILYKKNLQKS